MQRKGRKEDHDRGAMRGGAYNQGHLLGLLLVHGH